METRELQELLLSAMPLWHFCIAKPFKEKLDERVSIGMYYCLRHIGKYNGEITMSELARQVQCPKQQMTKTVNKLIECQMVERVSDPMDRRIIRLRLTEEGMQFIDHFLSEDAAYFLDMLNAMNTQDQQDFQQALETLCRILPSMLCQKTK